MRFFVSELILLRIFFFAFRKSKSSSVYVWLGYNNYGPHSATSAGVWKSQNGTDAAAPLYVWDSSQPNNISPGQCCLVTDKSASLNWNDFWCSNTTVGVVCFCDPSKHCRLLSELKLIGFLFIASNNHDHNNRFHNHQ